MVLRDMNQILRIEESSYSTPWTLEKFRGLLKRPTCACMVAVSGSKDVVLGFAVFEVGRGCLRLINLAVDPDFRRMGVATSLVGALKAKLRSRTFEVVVSDQFIEAHLFLKRQGFVAVKVLKGSSGSNYLFRLGVENGEC